MQEPRNLVNTEVGLSSFMTRMYGFMGYAVALSAIVAYLTGVVFRTQLMPVLVGHPFIFLFVLIGLMVFSASASRKALQNARTSFLILTLFSLFFGLEFSFIFLTFNLPTIASAFVSAAVTFASMSIIGATTHKDMTRVGNQLFAALIALFVIMIINLFLRSAAISYFFSFIGVVIFAGLSMTDTNKMKSLYLQYGDQVSMSGLAIQGALELYLDFLNLFQFLLQIFGGFGGSRD
ncbi:Bax inhibitor-1 family protein [Pediococcus cellicola]|uniref:Integral membrane protein, interacts with FtsH n=1 Tax=Pediococcus cellicola TaxID=319652 RepID=A0A0R2IRV9_9LACO|nr:Bax inhibitor-1/YccA family protein [Pediococcus cellicola]KRN67759.1 integral membrane protein, interacts with FtsH [Pediococcus cellicola]GEL14247.1 membrane protein [Pediococcus cellicola]